MLRKASIGVDFGTESARAVIVDSTNGNEIAVASKKYPHGVLNEKLPNGKKLKKNWALQVPSDYLIVLEHIINEVLKKSGLDTNEIIGLGIDFTASTILPLDTNLTPLCEKEEYKANPNSYVKLWKHHAAQPYANEINKLADEREESFLERHGGKISSEWLFPKVLQVLREDLPLYHQTDLFMEAGDWLVSKLTGHLHRSSNTSGYKAIWHHEDGYPSNDFLKNLDSNLDGIVQSKLRGDILSVGKRAGYLTDEFAEKLGLSKKTSVAVNIIDAHAANAAVGAVNNGDFVMALGTSTCQMLLSDKEIKVKGIAGCVKDGIIPNYFSYETGQVAVGDSFAWFVNECSSDKISVDAKENGRSIYEELEFKSKLRNEKNNLVALDWWNGNRTDLVDPDLSGLLVGMTLNTKPEDIYRALLESTAFGAKLIINNYKDSDLSINRIFACGGLPSKSQLLMQIYADVLEEPIYVASSKENTALGSSIYGALAAGKENGGYDSIEEAVKYMSKVKDKVVLPNEKNFKKYRKLYNIYKELHDIFGFQNKNIMHNLKEV